MIYVLLLLLMMMTSGLNSQLVFIARQYTSCLGPKRGGLNCEHSLNNGTLLYMYKFIFSVLQMKLMRDIRQSITEDMFPDFIQKFFLKRYPDRDFPEWTVEALNHVGVHLNTANDTKQNDSQIKT